jgi:hypothetical protein
VRAQQLSRNRQLAPFFALETKRKRKNSSPSSERSLSAASYGNEAPKSLGRPHRASAVAVGTPGMAPYLRAS